MPQYNVLQPTELPVVDKTVITSADAPGYEHAPFMQKPGSLMDTAFNLYGFLPEDDDPRWPFLIRYNDTRREVGFNGRNFANAWGATYLSPTPSRKNGYVTTISQDNTLQLDRALDNLSSIPDIAARFEQTVNEDRPVMSLCLTDTLNTNRGEPVPEVTPCPEALYQIRLDYNGYLARVGFNVHREEGVNVISLVNIQGARGAADRISQFVKQFGTSPFDMLVERVQALAGQGPEYEVRGLINPRRGDPHLYWGVLRSAGVVMIRQPANL
jgi:hypothetical protein